VLPVKPARVRVPPKNETGPAPTIVGLAVVLVPPLMTPLLMTVPPLYVLPRPPGWSVQGADANLGQSPVCRQASIIQNSALEGCGGIRIANS